MEKSVAVWGKVPETRPALVLRGCSVKVKEAPSFPVIFLTICSSITLPNAGILAIELILA